MAITVLDYILNIPINRPSYPLSRAKNQLFEKHNLAIITQLTLVGND